MNPVDVEAVIQKVRFELYRENIRGALEVLEAAHAGHPDPRYEVQAERIRSWLAHLESPEAYTEAQERQYKGLRAKFGLKRLEKEVRILLGRKTRKLVRRRASNPEFQLLAQEVLAVRPARVLDGGSGEGGVALALGARHPEIRVDGLEVSATNVRIARRLNRYPNVAFHQGLLEKAYRLFEPDSFDLIYSFAVLEHVRDVDETVGSLLKVLRPGGRFCFVVPMHEFIARGPIPEYTPIHGYADHVRVFTEAELRAHFGGHAEFTLHKIPGQWKPGKFPDCFVPVEFGSFFVAFSKS